MARADAGSVLEAHRRILRPRTTSATPLPSEMRAAYAALGRGRVVAECIEAFEGARSSAHNRSSGRDSVAWILANDDRMDALIDVARRRRTGPRGRVAPTASCTGGPLQAPVDDAMPIHELKRLSALAAAEIDGVGELFDAPIVCVAALREETP